jgi:hypothetical protein
VLTKPSIRVLYELCGGKEQMRRTISPFLKLRHF